MNVVVIEDEKLAAERLIEMLRLISADIYVLKSLDSVFSAVSWLNYNTHPDLIFMDIQLADGLCFEIFKQTKLDVPVIFTTAYNEYALRAFKVNSVDYLLKPLDLSELKAAIHKFQKLTKAEQAINPKLIKQVMEMIQNPYRIRFVVKIGEHIKTISVDDIACFYSNDKNSYIRTSSGRDFDIDLSLDQQELELDPKQFFRVNRKYVIAIQYIKDIISYSGNRLKLIVNGSEAIEILVSREKVSDFKKWLEG